METIKIKPCVVCGKNILVKKGKYCSEECKEKYLNSGEYKSKLKHYAETYRVRTKDRKRYENLKTE